MPLGTGMATAMEKVAHLVWFSYNLSFSSTPCPWTSPAHAFQFLERRERIRLTNVRKHPQYFCTRGPSIFNNCLVNSKTLQCHTVSKAKKGAEW